MTGTRLQHLPALLAAGLLSWLPLRVGAAETELPAFRIGFSSASFSEVNHNDAAAAVQVWSRMLATERNIDADPQPRILRSANDIASALTNGLVDAVNLTTPEYFSIRNQVHLENFIYSVKQDRTIAEQYVMLVHADSPFHTPADLAGRDLVILRSPRMALAHAWLDTLLAEKQLSQLETHFGSYLELPGPTKVALSVFFGKKHACLVTRSALDTMIELNPRTGEKLRVIAESPPLVPSVFGFRSDYQSPVRQQLLREIGLWHTNPSGRQILNMFQCDRLEERPADALAATLELLALHDRLCGPHVPGGASRTNAGNAIGTQTPPARNPLE